jgi:hypothetical protein
MTARRVCVDLPEEQRALFTGTNAEQLQAIEYCEFCPFRDPCLLDGLKRPVPVGVWGGHTQNQRKELRRKMDASAPQEFTYRGVSLRAGPPARWVAHIRVGSKVHYLGGFAPTPVGAALAAQAYDRAARMFHGARAVTNFPETVGAVVALPDTIRRRAAKTSRFHGVQWVATRKRWRAMLSCGAGKPKLYLGTFPPTPEGEEEAALAYDRAAYVMHGNAAILNFPRITDGGEPT